MRAYEASVARKIVNVFGAVVCLLVAGPRVGANQLVAEGEVKFKMLSEFFGGAPARGTYLVRQEVTQPEYPTVAVLIKGNGDIAQLMLALRDNSDLIPLKRAQEAVRKYESISQPAAAVTLTSALAEGPINEFIWYAPLEAFSDVGIQVADLSQAYGKHVRRLPAPYVLHVVGGRALRSWPSNASSAPRTVPSEATLASFIRNPELHRVSPEAAHYMLAFGDRDSRLRVAYLQARDALPLLWENYEAVGRADQLGALIAEAYWIATTSSTGNSGWLLVVVVVTITGLCATIYLLAHLAHRRRTKQRLSPADPLQTQDV